MSIKIKWLSVIFLSCFITTSQFEPRYPRAQTPDTETQAIYIVNHGWHTGFVVPAIAMQTQLPALKSRFNSPPYFEIGWGDKGFYQARQVTSGLTLRAMFWSSGSVIQVVAVPATVKNYFSKVQVEKLCLTPAQQRALIQFIAHSFAKDNHGQIMPRQRGRYGDSQFYAASDTYHIFNTCNKWVAKGLQQAQMPIDPWLKLTAGSVMNEVATHIAQAQAASCYQHNQAQ